MRTLPFAGAQTQGIGRIFRTRCEELSFHDGGGKSGTFLPARKSTALGLISKKEQEFQRELAQLELGLKIGCRRYRDALADAPGSLLMCTMVTPKLLLLDEHLQHLTLPQLKRCFPSPKRIVEENHITTLMITHNIRSNSEGMIVPS